MGARQMNETGFLRPVAGLARPPVGWMASEAGDSVCVACGRRPTAHYAIISAYVCILRVSRVSRFKENPR